MPLRGEEPSATLLNLAPFGLGEFSEIDFPKLDSASSVSWWCKSSLHALFLILTDLVIVQRIKLPHER
jgi:hypothetical protein